MINIEPTLFQRHTRLHWANLETTLWPSNRSRVAAVTTDISCSFGQSYMIDTNRDVEVYHLSAESTCYDILTFEHD